MRMAMRPHWASCPCCPRLRRPTSRHGSTQVGAVQCLGTLCAWQGHMSYALNILSMSRAKTACQRRIVPAVMVTDAWHTSIQLLCRWHRQGGGHSPGQPGRQPLASRALTHSLSSRGALPRPSRRSGPLRLRDAARPGGQGCKSALASACVCCWRVSIWTHARHSSLIAVELGCHQPVLACPGQ